MQTSFLVGCGAGFSGDRLDAAPPVVKTLIARGGSSAIIFENLAERTMAFAHLAKSRDPEQGYETMLEQELRPVLRDCLEHGITIVGNFGAANPLGAAQKIQELAHEMKLASPRIAIVTGDDLSGDEGIQILEEACEGRLDYSRFVSANAYQGAFPIADAIRAGAQIVVAGRVADTALTLGPAIAHFGWHEEEWNELAGASVAGHLLECGSQVCGGYFSDPGKKDVPDMANLGFPIAEIMADGTFTLTKADDTGGLLDSRTVTEQLLYEVHDPASFLMPDVIADLTEVELETLGPNTVRVSGVQGHPRPTMLKTNIYFQDGWQGEAEISYSGYNAESRARLSMDIIQQRMRGSLHMRFDIIGAVSILAGDDGKLLRDTPTGSATDVRLRVAGRHQDVAMIDRMLHEVNALYNNGPAGGGGVRLRKEPRLAMRTCMIPRELAPSGYAFTNYHGKKLP